MARTLEVAYIASTTDLERANARAAASTRAAAAEISTAGGRVGGSYVSMAGAGKKAAAELEGSHNRVVSSLSGVARSSNLATAGIVAFGAAVYGVKKSADTLAELADETRKLHNVTGLSVHSASAYAAVAKTQEIPVKALNQAFGTLSKNLHAVENAHDGVTKAAHTQENAFKQLGLPLASITKAHGDLNKLLPEITARFEHLPGSVNKAAIGMALFGRGWQTLVPLMHEGALGLKEQLNEAEKMGATLSGNTTQKLKEFAKQQEEAKYASLGLQLAIGQYVAPALTKLIHGLADTAHSLGEGVHWLEKHEAAAKALAGVIGTVLGGALTVFAYSKAKKFEEATGDMIGSMKALAVRMGLTAGAVTAADDTIVAENEAVGASWSLLVPGAALIAASAGAGYELGKHWKEVSKGIEEAAQAMGNFVIDRLNEMIHAANQALGKLTLGLSPAIPGLGRLSGAGGGEGGGSGGLGRISKGNIGDFSSLEGTSSGHSRSQADYLEKLGVPAIVAAGLAGNFAQEGRATDTGASGLGIGQWMGPRRAALEALARSLHKKPTDEGVQLAFAAKELKDSYGSVYQRALHARTPQEAANILAGHAERGIGGYENPKESEANYAHREEAAARAYRRPHHEAAGGGYYETGSTGSSSGGAGRAHAKAMAKARALTEGYANPFAGATNLHRSRTDQGVDFSFAGKLGAVGKGRIVNIVQDPGGFGTEVVEELTEGPHKGQFVYYGLETGAILGISKGATVKAGQRVATGKGSGGIELGFAAGASGVPLTPFAPGASHEHATAGGTAFSSFLASIGKTGSNLQAATGTFAQIMKQTLGELVSPSQQRALHAHVEAAGMDRGEASMYGGFAGDVGSYLQGAQAKWGRQKLNLAKPGDAALQKSRDEAPIYAAQAQRKYYQREVKALQAEAREWGKIRDSYRRFARHATGPGAKKEALHKAAEFDGKVKQAQKEAGELGGAITAATEADEGAQATLAGLPGEVSEAALGGYQAANAKVDLEVRAGAKTAAEGKAAKEANANAALASGQLTPEGVLQVRGDLKEFSEALTSATEAVEAHTQAVLEATKAELAKAQAARRISEVESGTLLKAIADLVSGQIGGIDYHGRAMTAGAGTAARY